MAHGKPRKGDAQVSPAMSEEAAKAFIRELARTITNMGHGSTTHYYVAKCGSSHAVYRCKTD